MMMRKNNNKKSLRECEDEGEECEDDNGSRRTA